MISDTDLSDMKELMRSAQYEPNETQRKLYRNMLVDMILRCGRDMLEEIEAKRKFAAECKAFFANLVGEGESGY